MTTRATVSTPSISLPREGWNLWSTPGATMLERIERIDALGQRIGGYIKFMSQVGEMTGSSTEAKERAVSAFYENLLMVEQQLRRIQENFQLE